MKVRVLFFAVLAQRAGVREMPLELDKGATVADALARVATAHTAIAAMSRDLAVAVDCEYVGTEHVLADGVEMALIPPVSGG